MVPNCKGCEYERNEVELAVIEGYHIATAIGREFSGRGHYCLLLVDDNGEVVAK